jgi:2-oxoglutarate ferredoxin oxidoreductase subunit alpha
VQRGGPSTGLPTKTEQADLMQAYYGRNGECPVPIVAPATPGECFHMMIEAFRIAVTYMVPVFFLSDGYLANGSEPWLLPDMSKIKPIKPCGWEPNGREFKPYLRDERTLARPWVNPGMAGFEHRIGGIEKANITGNVSYDPDNHDAMIRLRQEKVDRVAQDIPDLEVVGAPEGEVLVLGWGSTYGTCLTAVERLRNKGLKVSLAHLRYLRPFPKNTEEVLRRFKKVIIPEINLGQLRSLIRDKYLIDAVGFNKVKGLPLKTHEIEEAVTVLCNSH